MSLSNLITSSTSTGRKEKKRTTSGPGNKISKSILSNILGVARHNLLTVMTFLISASTWRSSAQTWEPVEDILLSKPKDISRWKAALANSPGLWKYQIWETQKLLMRHTHCTV